MKNLSKQFSKFFIAGIVLLSLLTSCDQKVKGKAILSEITLNGTKLTSSELTAAGKGAGFTKVFPSNVTSVKLEAKAEDGAVIKINPSAAITLTENAQTVTITVSKQGKNNSTYKLNLSKEKKIEPPALPELTNFKATDFEGAFASDVDYYVINSTLTWDAFKGAAYYNVFINGKRTNDPADGNLTKTKFKTAEGIIDLDKKMGDAEKEIKISVKAYSSADKVIAESTVVKMLPRKNKIGNITINGTALSEGSEVLNPVEIKIELNNGFKLIDEDIKKALQNCQNYIQVTYFDDGRSCDFSYSNAENALFVKPLGGLKENTSYKLVIKKGFKDKHNMDYTNKDLSYTFKIKPSENLPAPAVEKVLINDDPNLDLKKGVKYNVNVESSVSIYFNQLIEVSSFTHATQGDDGTKGKGIFITEHKTRKGSGSSRLIDAKFENVMLEGKKFVTKATFKMVGKAGFFSSEPLNGNTDYWICIEDDLRNTAWKKFSDERFKFSTGEEKPVLHTLEVKDGIIVGKAEKPFNIAKIKAGESVTIKAVPMEGKVFDYWYVGEYFKPELNEEEKHSNPLTFKMKGEDVHFTAHFKNAPSITVPEGFVKVTAPENGIIGKTPSYKTPVGASEAWWKGVFTEGRTVTLSPYYIAKHEVTYKLWKEVYDWAASHGYKFVAMGYNGSLNTGDEMQPVTNITWRDAVIWCNAYTEKLSGSTAHCVYRSSSNEVLKNALDNEAFVKVIFSEIAKGFRLPTEAEWEFAARYNNSATQTENTEMYGSSLFLLNLDCASGAALPVPFRGMSLPSGKTWEDLRDETSKYSVYNNWFNGTSFIPQNPVVTGTAKVGSKIANALGLFDMSGNVSEWCWDIYDENPVIGDTGSSVKDPKGPETKTNPSQPESRIVRGGSWFYDSMHCTVGYRFNARANVYALNNKPAFILVKTNELGFRLAASF